MKRSRFTEEQIIGELREQEAGMKTADVCRRHGISSATLYAWKAKFGGMDVSEAKLLNAHWFLSLADAREKMEAWLKDYNEDRPHGAIGHRPPILLQSLSGATSPPP